MHWRGHVTLGIDGKELIVLKLDKYEINSMLLKDYKEDISLIRKVSNLGAIPDDEQLTALITIISKAADLPLEEIENNFNLEMAKDAIIGYLANNGVPYKIIDNMNGVIYLDKIKTGTVIVDRNGKEHKAHSVMFKDMDRLREILPKIDSIVTVNNIFDMENGEYVDDAYMALIELLKMTLDDTQEEIESYLDAEFARKAIRVCLDLPIA